MKKYVVVTVIDREIYCQFAETLEKAQELMQKDIDGIIEGVNVHDSITESELIDDNFMCKELLSAWITYDEVDFDARIVEIK